MILSSFSLGNLHRNAYESNHQSAEQRKAFSDTYLVSFFSAHNVLPDGLLAKSQSFVLELN